MSELKLKFRIVCGSRHQQKSVRRLAIANSFWGLDSKGQKACAWSVCPFRAEMRCVLRERETNLLRRTSELRMDTRTRRLKKEECVKVQIQDRKTRMKKVKERLNQDVEHALQACECEWMKTGSVGDHLPHFENEFKSEKRNWTSKS